MPRGLELLKFVLKNLVQILLKPTMLTESVDYSNKVGDLFMFPIIIGIYLAMLRPAASISKTYRNPLT